MRICGSGFPPRNHASAFWSCNPLRRVIVYGTICLDRFVRPGQTEDNATEFPGGEAFNTATALAGWGVPVMLTGTAVGDDAEGLRLRELLLSHPLAKGIDLSLVPLVSGAVTPVCTVRVNAAGERFMSGRGFNQATAPDLETILPHFAGKPLFTIDPNLGGAAIEATLAAAKAGCKIISMDFARVPDILAVSHVAVTSHEWVARSGQRQQDGDAARQMANAGARLAIVTQGDVGGISYAMCKDGFTSGLHQGDVLYVYTAAPLSPQDRIIDTTGAGDTFRAGLCYCQFSGLNIAGTLRFASAAAALHCTTFGGGSRFSGESVRSLAAHVRVRRISDHQTNT